MTERKIVSCDSRLPEDATLIKQTNAVDFYFSKSDYSFFVVITDYHSGPLKLSQDDLLEFLRIIEEHKKEVEQEISRELEKHMKTVIEKEKDRQIFKEAKVKLWLSERD